jgi:hypothetical protein
VGPCFRHGGREKAPVFGGESLRKKALLFLKKKKQKDFLCRALGAVAASAHAQESKKFFGSFFQKRTACLKLEF